MRNWIGVLAIILFVFAACSAPQAQVPIAAKVVPQPQGWVESTPTGAVMSFTNISTGHTVEVVWQGGDVVSVGIVNGERSLFKLPTLFADVGQPGLVCKIGNVRPVCLTDPKVLKRNY